MIVRQNYDLQALNTLAVPSLARWYVELFHEQDLQEVFAWVKQDALPWAVLGGGSNVLLPPKLDGVVLSDRRSGWQVIKHSSEHVWLRVAAGQNWHEFVCACLYNQWYGLENLALIPGTVGAAPIQNIGAYGVEVEQFVSQVGWYDFESGEVQNLNHSACEFSYRDSIFKRALLGRGIITNVTLRLNRQFQAQCEYPALQAAIASDTDGSNITAQAMFNAVCKVRQTKLPDPKKIPNCGSFFKNPVVKLSDYQSLSERFSDVPSFSVGQDDRVKIPAAWLIQQAGWKGEGVGGVTMHSGHALVLVNPLHRDLTDVLLLADRIVEDVWRLSGIRLEREPQILQVQMGGHG